MLAVDTATRVDSSHPSGYDQRVGLALDKLFTFVNDKAYREGTFTLASGKQSPYYFDGKSVLFDQEGSRLFAGWLLSRLREMTPRPVAVGGLEIGAIPIACTAMAMADFPIGAFVVRKVAKEHGTGKTVEGNVREGDLVAIVDDVITTGASTLKAVNAVRAMGCTIGGIFCLMDRQEDHSPEFDAYRRVFTPAFTMASFRERRAALLSRR
jgi:orotate phosphoribosyltransferase